MVGSEGQFSPDGATATAGWEDETYPGHIDDDYEASASAEADPDDPGNQPTEQESADTLVDALTSHPDLANVVTNEALHFSFRTGSSGKETWSSSLDVENEAGEQATIELDLTEILGHDPELRDEILNLEPGDKPIIRINKITNDAGQEVTTATAYVRTAGSIVVMTGERLVEEEKEELEEANDSTDTDGWTDGGEESEPEKLASPTVSDPAPAMQPVARSGRKEPEQAESEYKYSYQSASEATEPVPSTTQVAPTAAPSTPAAASLSAMEAYELTHPMTEPLVTGLTQIAEVVTPLPSPDPELAFHREPLVATRLDALTVSSVRTPDVTLPEPGVASALTPEPFVLKPRKAPRRQVNEQPAETSAPASEPVPEPKPEPMASTFPDTKPPEPRINIEPPSPEKPQPDLHSDAPEAPLVAITEPTPVPAVKPEAPMESAPSRPLLEPVQPVAESKPPAIPETPAPSPPGKTLEMPAAESHLETGSVAIESIAAVAVEAVAPVVALESASDVFIAELPAPAEAADLQSVATETPDRFADLLMPASEEEQAALETPDSSEIRNEIPASEQPEQSELPPSAGIFEVADALTEFEEPAAKADAALVEAMSQPLEVAVDTPIPAIQVGSVSEVADALPELQEPSQEEATLEAMAVIAPATEAPTEMAAPVAAEITETLAETAGAPILAEQPGPEIPAVVIEQPVALEAVATTQATNATPAAAGQPVAVPAAEAVIPDLIDQLEQLPWEDVALQTAPNLPPQQGAENFGFAASKAGQFADDDDDLAITFELATDSRPATRGRRSNTARASV